MVFKSLSSYYGFYVAERTIEISPNADKVSISDTTTYAYTRPVGEIFHVFKLPRNQSTADTIKVDRTFLTSSLRPENPETFICSKKTAKRKDGTDGKNDQDWESIYLEDIYATRTSVPQESKVMLGEPLFRTVATYQRPPFDKRSGHQDKLYFNIDAPTRILNVVINKADGENIQEYDLKFAMPEDIEYSQVRRSVQRTQPIKRHEGEKSILECRFPPLSVVGELTVDARATV